MLSFSTESELKLVVAEPVEDNILIDDHDRARVINFPFRLIRHLRIYKPSP